MEEPLSESSSSLIVQALERALTAPDGLPLQATKQTAGLFPATGKAAAQEARSAGLVRVLRTEPKGKTAIEYCTLTEKGLAFLLEQSSPRPVLEGVRTAIDACQARIETWISSVEESRKYLDGLRSLAERVLTHLQKPETTLPHWARNGHAHEPQSIIIESLRGWQSAGKIGDCPLPELYEQTRAKSAKLTLGQFHDALRALYEQRAIYLHPWTGPLHELPQPALSLLVGHEIAYYASLRS
jgi:hypothetical protein